LTLLGIGLFCLAVASVMNEPNGGSSKK
jgi:hypothetical protein